MAQKKPHEIKVRFSDEELAVLKRLQQQRGCSLSSAARLAALLGMFGVMGTVAEEIASAPENNRPTLGHFLAAAA